MSDHSVIKFECEFATDKVTINDKFRFEKGDYGQFCDFVDVDWDNVLNVSSVDEMWEKLLSLPCWMVWINLYPKVK